MKLVPCPSRGHTDTGSREAEWGEQESDLRQVLRVCNRISPSRKPREARLREVEPPACGSTARKPPSDLKPGSDSERLPSERMSSGLRRKCRVEK